MKDFKLLRNNATYTTLFQGMEILEVLPLMYNPDSFEPMRNVSFRYDDGTVYWITIRTDHPQWNELREKYP